MSIVDQHRLLNSSGDQHQASTTPSMKNSSRPTKNITHSTTDLV